MPHQCLKCGKIFEEGSQQLLIGCPECNGNRFFYTKEPLTEEERNVVNQDVEQDLTTKIMELIGDSNVETLEKKGKWAAVKPKEIRKLLEKQQEEEPKHHTESTIVIDDQRRKQIMEKLQVDTYNDEKPETIDIERPGRYNIDLKGLLEQEPIIIQKDGTYTIHLPSIFKMVNKEK